jgi:methyl coenzyme M reductase subunit D
MDFKNSKIIQQKIDIEEKLRNLEVNKDWKLQITVELTNIDKEGLKKVLEILQEHIPFKYKIKGLYSKWLPREDRQELYQNYDAHKKNIK